MSPDEFDRLVGAAYARIPARFRKRMKNIALLVEPEPSADQLARGHVPRGNTLLGLYEGRPHERLARDPEHLVRLVEDTVWHEVAHYFGLDEARVRAAERRRRR